MFRKNRNHGEMGLFGTRSTANNTRKLILDNHWSNKFYNIVFKNIREEDFLPIYCANNGRPNFPVNILVGLEVIKELHGLSDIALYENYHFNELFQNAFGIENINDRSFTLKTLYNFRASKSEYERETGVDLDQLVFKNLSDDAIKKLGIKTDIQRTDSVHISANIKKMSRLTLFHKVLSNLIKEVKKLEIKISDELESIISIEEDSYYYHLATSLVTTKTNDIAEFLYTYIERFKSDERINKTKAYLNGHRLLEEQCNIEKSKLKLKEPSEIPSGSLQNPADSDATYRLKRGESHKGYFAHAVETCSPDNKVQIITQIDVVKNNVDDAFVLNQNLTELYQRTNVQVIINDGGYVSEEVTETCAKLGITQIATAIKGRKPNEDQLDSTDFKRNDDGLIDTCPNGQIPKKQTLSENGTLTANFDIKICNVCPLKEKCIAYKSDKQSTIQINKHREFIDNRKLFQYTLEYESLAKLRPNVEATMEKLKPKYLVGRTLFRGLAKVKSRMTLKAISINFRRVSSFFYTFINLLQILLRPSRKYSFY
jgi:hypothetical protein